MLMSRMEIGMMEAVEEGVYWRRKGNSRMRIEFRMRLGANQKAGPAVVLMRVLR